MEITGIDFLKYKRINVIGCPGSGKSSTVKYIHSKTNYPIIDLDEVFYSEKCKRLNDYDSHSIMDSLLEMDRFIIDGTYTSTFEKRLEFIDLVILVDTNWLKSFFRFFKRLLFSRNLKCGERLTRKTLLLLLFYPIKTRPYLTRVILKRKIFLIKTSI
jgi:adenylate kinase family enzyme